VLRFIQGLASILERFAIDLCAAFRIEIRHCYLRPSVNVCLCLSEHAKLPWLTLLAYSISFLDFVDFDDEVLSRDRLVFDEETD
jgi:hypothetical protein